MPRRNQFDVGQLRQKKGVLRQLKLNVISSAMLFFLDIDGVMVPAKSWSVPEFLEDGFPVFSARATAALQQLITSDDTLILTSSHKSNHTLDEWIRIFRNRGIEITTIRVLPENSNNSSRKDELVNWFKNNEVNQNVKTSPLIGLTEEHTTTINIILGRQLQPAN